MTKDVTRKLKKMHVIRKIIRPAYFLYIDILTGIRIRMDIGKLKRLSDYQKRIYLLGIPTASNIGDMAQYFLILEWLRSNFQGYEVVDFPTRSILYRNCQFLDILEKKLKSGDYIFFQSGYNTHDLGGEEDLMHKIVISRFAGHKMVMLPQTVFFQSKDRERQSSEAYSKNKEMLFLARDRMSYQSACRMFPDLRVALYPDIVTTLIGKYHFGGERKGVLICHRADGEKFYSAEEINELKMNIKRMAIVDSADTTISLPNMFLKRNVRKYLERMLRHFSHYQIIITDRYHGTILSLVAQTPVIVIKTTDHKVTTGLEWFEGVYDSYLYCAKDLKDVELKVSEWLRYPPKEKIEPYFEKEYYCYLKELIEKEG